MSSTNGLVRQLARRTGESGRTIARRGFHEVGVFPSQSADNDEDDDRIALFVKCPDCGRPVFLASSPVDLPDAADCPLCKTLFAYGDAEIDVVDLSADRDLFGDG